jgi:hypothetical protein
VKAAIDRLARDAAELEGLGVRTAAICSNDARRYSEDSFDNMKAFAARHRLHFPYLHDESQEVARAYGAVCTPDFFGFDRDGILAYRGRLDEGRMERAGGARRELFEAMREIAEGRKPTAEQVPLIGCSIKWKTD